MSFVSEGQEGGKAWRIMQETHIGWQYGYGAQGNGEWVWKRRSGRGLFARLGLERLNVGPLLGIGRHRVRLVLLPGAFQALFFINLRFLPKPLGLVEQARWKRLNQGQPSGRRFHVDVASICISCRACEQ